MIALTVWALLASLAAMVLGHLWLDERAKYRALKLWCNRSYGRSERSG